MSKTEIIITILVALIIVVLTTCSIKFKADNESLEFRMRIIESSRDEVMRLYSKVCEENKKLKKENSELKDDIESWKKIEDVKLTAYCPCEECSGQWGTKTKMGTTATEGRTIAVDPDVIPLGSEVKIGDTIYIAEDIGGKVRGKTIDVFFNEHKVDFKKYVDVLVRV